MKNPDCKGVALGKDKNRALKEWFFFFCFFVFVFFFFWGGAASWPLISVLVAKIPVSVHRVRKPIKINNRWCFVYGNLCQCLAGLKLAGFLECHSECILS